MNVLVTGGCGYIGSHAVLRLLEHGHAVTVIDDLSRGHRAVIDRLQPLGDLTFVQLDIGDRPAVASVLRDRRIELVMHFAARAYVGESVQMPLAYYRSNTAGSLGLLEAMAEAGVHRIVLSSTCATYGEPAAMHIPISERCPQQPVNPYGWSKLLVEQMLRDQAVACRAQRTPFQYAILRYFNVAGSDPAMRIGEVHDPETHLIPLCVDAALGRRDALTIFGTDHATPDGTCIRDYVHVDDLIAAHVQVMHAMCNDDGGDGDGDDAAQVYNVGIGRGYSVREVIDAVKDVTASDFNVIEGERRPGDPPMLYSDATKLQSQLGGQARYSLRDMIEHTLQWRTRNPHGCSWLS